MGHEEVRLTARRKEARAIAHYHSEFKGSNWHLSTSRTGLHRPVCILIHPNLSVHLSQKVIRGLLERNERNRVREVMPKARWYHIAHAIHVRLVSRWHLAGCAKSVNGLTK